MIVSHLIVLLTCDVTDVQPTLTFHRCRAADPTGQYFTINECPVGQVMNIQSSELGYSHAYYPNSNPPQCPGNDCAVANDEPVRLCNGRHTCRISQEILIYPQGSALCSLQRDGNFIRIRFTCVTGMTFTCTITLHRHLIYYLISQSLHGCLR